MLAANLLGVTAHGEIAPVAYVASLMMVAPWFGAHGWSLGSGEQELVQHTFNKLLPSVPFDDTGFPILEHRKKIQHELTVELHKGARIDLDVSLDDPGRVRLVACSAKGAGLWLKVVPTSPATTLADGAYVLALRMRLGLCPPAAHCAIGPRGLAG